MKTLGIHQSGLTASAVLVIDDTIVAGGAEERFTREKYQRGFPVHAANFCLEQAGLTWDDLDCIAVGWNPAINLSQKYQGKFSDRARFAGDWLHSVPNTVLNLIDNTEPGATVQTFSFNGKKIKICYVNHHDAHAAKAFFMSPFESASILTVDHYGEHATTTWKTADTDSITTLKEICFPDSIGAFYAALTEFLGYRAHKDEWKIMGLAAYGDHQKYSDKLMKLVDLKDDGGYNLDLAYFNHFSFETKGLFSPKLIQLIGTPRKYEDEITSDHCDIAASAQYVIEKILFNCLEGLYKMTGNTNLCLSGGCIMNSVFNGKVLARLPYERLYVPFSPDDTGNSIGAALYANWFLTESDRKRKPSCDDSPYLGPSYTDDYIESILQGFHLSYEKLEDPEKTAAGLLSENNIIGWFQGRMEFGARALGNRSILADPRHGSMKDKINEAVKYRETFRPFAPSILEENVGEYFIVPDEAEGCRVPFMEKVFQVRPERQADIPAVVHADGSGRLQTVSREKNPLYHGLISVFKDITGVPVVLNTSFNRKGEPIVCTPEDALRTFMTCGLDAVIINSYLVRK